MDEDDIAQVFADIKPEDFERETSARDRITYTPEQYHITTGRNNFDGFVDAHVRRSKAAALKPSGFHAFSTLHSSTEQRHFHPDDDETASQYASRLAREANDMQATWFYTAMLAPGRAYVDGEDPPDVDADDPEALTAALESGVLHLSICWYAEDSEEDPPLRRSGIIVLDEAGHPASEVEGEIDADSNPFHYVMGNHA